jgi:RNA polymerase sigma factor (TIGR02999 family)
MDDDDDTSFLTAPLPKIGYLDLPVLSGYASRPTPPPACLGLVHSDSTTQVTQLLARWRDGDREALDSLMPLVYDELRRLAHHYLQNERHGHTLQSTALVHEAYVRLVGQSPPQWQNRSHFFGVAAHLMRQILVDYARGHRAGKRGGDSFKLTLEDAAPTAQPVDVDIVALDDALKTLTQMDPQQGRVVELRFFAGLTIEDTSEVLGISAATVKREWTIARTWLFRELDRTSERTAEI